MDKKKNENFFLKLIEIKKEIRDCVQSGSRPERCRKLWHRILNPMKLMRRSH